MRQTALVEPGYGDVKRLMIYEADDGCYLFSYAALDDGPGLGDSWFVNASEAKQVCQDEYGVTASDWSDVPEPPPGCQHDIIAPTMLVRDEDGNSFLRPM